MDSLLEPVELNRETAQALDEIRSGAENALYGAASADAEEKVNNSVLPLIEGAGLPGLHVMHYRWYLRELARHWRTRKGRDLAFHLELCIRKWVGLGLEPRTLQFLICEAHQRLKGQNLTTKAPSHQEVQPEPQNPRTPGPQSLTTKTPRHEEARDPEPENPGTPEPGDTGPLESSTPRILPVDFSRPGIMSGPRPPADPTAGSSPATSPSPLTPDIETAKDAKVAKPGPDLDPRTPEPLDPRVTP